MLSKGKRSVRKIMSRSKEAPYFRRDNHNEAYFGQVEVEVSAILAEVARKNNIDGAVTAHPANLDLSEEQDRRRSTIDILSFPIFESRAYRAHKSRIRRSIQDSKSNFEKREANQTYVLVKTARNVTAENVLELVDAIGS
jgi:uncharacterized membrane protein YgaE (UPF0421/DUF939 family)